jgi:hypothetical protein
MASTFDTRVAPIFEGQFFFTSTPTRAPNLFQQINNDTWDPLVIPSLIYLLSYARVEKRTTSREQPDPVEEDDLFEEVVESCREEWSACPQGGFTKRKPGMNGKDLIGRCGTAEGKLDIFLVHRLLSAGRRSRSAFGPRR